MITDDEPIKMNNVKSITNVVDEAKFGIVMGSAYGIELDKNYILLNLYNQA